VGLSVRTLRLRRRLRIAIGDAQEPAMLRAMRVHANFAEYVPLSLLLLYLVEASGADAWFVHALGASLLVGRVAHAYGVSQTKENYRYRVAGMALTFTPLIAMAARLLYVFATSSGLQPRAWIRGSDRFTLAFTRATLHRHGVGNGRGASSSRQARPPAADQLERRAP
jgi:uncharacterized protein